MINKHTIYPIIDENSFHSRKHQGKGAVWKGERRHPLKDEWYFSGAVIEAYQAPNDLSTVYHIAHIEYVKKTITYSVNGMRFNKA